MGHNSRVLRLYMATQDPTRNLCDVVNYNKVVYIPMTFNLQCNPSVRDGAKHVFNTIRREMHLDQRLQEIVLPVVQRTAYFAHSEIILLSMVTYKTPTVRELEQRKTLKARNDSNKLDKYIRYFSYKQKR